MIDALGERWAGELCQDNYLATGYFSSEAQDSVRWLYYRKGTEGQNTILYNGSNQIVDASSFTRFESSGNVQTSSGSSNTHNTNGDENNTAYWIANLTMSYNGTAVERGMRLLNDRTQVLIQDEITNATAGSQWRMHTNASITYDRDNKTASKPVPLPSSKALRLSFNPYRPRPPRQILNCYSSIPGECVLPHAAANTTPHESSVACGRD